MAVVGQRVAEDDVADVLPLDEHVRLADGVGLRVELLPVHREPRLGIHRCQVLFRNRQHAARPGRRIVDRAHDARLGQDLVILSEDEIDHEANDLARGEVFASRLVRDFGELADQLLEHEAHLRVVDAVRVEIDAREPLRHEIEQVRLGEPVDLHRELEALEDVADVLREAAHVVAQMRADVVLIAHEPAEVERRDIVEAEARLAPDERIRVHPRFLLVLELLERRRLGRPKNAIEPSQDSERQNDLAVVRLLVVAPQQVGDRPYEGGKGLVVHEKVPARRHRRSATGISPNIFERF